MNCSDARKILYPLPEKCAPTIESGRATGHLRECADCRQYFERQTKLVEMLKQKVGIESTPEPLRDRIAEMVKKARAPRLWEQPWMGRWGRFAAAVLVFAALPVVWFAYRLPSVQFFQELCEDHVRYLSAESQVRSSDPSVLEAWFREKADFGVRVPKFDSAELLGGRLCFLKKRKAALVFYSKQGKPVSLFQFNGRGIILGVLDRAEIDGASLWRMSFKGYSLAAFENRGVIYALVSELRESELLECASAARAKSKGF